MRIRKLIYGLVIATSLLLIWGANSTPTKPLLRIEGEGSLFDSAWIHHTILQHNAQDIGSIYQRLQQLGVYERIHIHPHVQEGIRIWVRSREPLLRIVLPLRSLYMDSSGELFPAIRPVSVPILYTDRVDTLALEGIRQALTKAPLLFYLISHMEKDEKGVYWVYTQLSGEAFCVGQSEVIGTTLPKIVMYYKHLRRYVDSAQKILLQIPNQVICQKK